MTTRTRILFAASTLLLGLGVWWTQNPKPDSAPTPGRTATVSDLGATTVSPRVTPASEPIVHPNKPAPVRTNDPTRVAASKNDHTPAQGLHRLPVQRFSVNARRDTLLRTAAGCTVHVPAGCFVDASGKPVEEQVTVHVQEALTPAELVLGGLCTVYQGKALESGGSFSIAASAMGRALELAKGHALSMAVPTRMKKAGMKLFPGMVREGQVVWQEPAPLEEPVVQAGSRSPIEGLIVTLDTLTTNVTYRVEGFDDPLDAPIEVTNRVSEVAWAGGGLMLQRDSSFTVGKYRVHFFANEVPSSTNVVPIVQGNFARQGGSVAGLNTFQEDPAVNYVFQVKRLGWANIDRLLHDKRTRPVDLVTTIANAADLKDVRISLVMKSHNLYLPGYQRADGSYGFSHGDFERMELPIGADAVIVATAQRNGKPWLALQELKIAPTASVELRMQPTTDQELRAALMDAL
jgi:hypothetical protein